MNWPVLRAPLYTKSKYKGKLCGLKDILYCSSNILGYVHLNLSLKFGRLSLIFNAKFSTQSLNLRSLFRKIKHRSSFLCPAIWISAMGNQETNDFRRPDNKDTLKDGLFLLLE